MSSFLICPCVLEVEVVMMIMTIITEHNSYFGFVQLIFSSGPSTIIKCTYIGGHS